MLPYTVDTLMGDPLEKRCAAASPILYTRVEGSLRLSSTPPSMIHLASRNSLQHPSVPLEALSVLCKHVFTGRSWTVATWRPKQAGRHTNVSNIPPSHVEPPICRTRSTGTKLPPVNHEISESTASTLMKLHRHTKHSTDVKETKSSRYTLLYRNITLQELRPPNCLSSNSHTFTYYLLAQLRVLSAGLDQLTFSPTSKKPHAGHQPTSTASKNSSLQSDDAR